MNNFRSNFIRERTKRNLSQHQIAKELDLNQKAIGSYEEGRAVPKIDKLIQIADYFKISIDQLVK
jgi:transcriptional regulator with XRE-family HTH domain